MTAVRWLLYHDFHQLGIIDVSELLAFHIHKRGSLSARPYEDKGDVVEYLSLPLNYNVTYIHIYRRQMGPDVDVFDMHVV